MTRALDGTYWRVRSNDETIGEYDAIELAYPMASQLSAEYPNVSIVRIRPRMSIVKAVRLLTEARANGVELWMRRVNVAWWVRVEECGSFEEMDVYNGWYDAGAFVASHIQDKWIVATPEDARKIDARKASK